MKHVKLFEEFSSVNEAQETLRKELKKIHKSNPEGMDEESSAEHIEELGKTHGDKQKEIDKFFKMMADMKAMNDDLEGAEGDDEEEAKAKIEDLDSKISELITNLG